MNIAVGGFKIVPYILPDKDVVVLHNGIKLEPYRSFQLKVQGGWRKNHTILETLRVSRKSMVDYIERLSLLLGIQYSKNLFTKTDIEAMAWLDQETADIYVSCTEVCFKDIYDALLGVRNISLAYYAFLEKDEFFIDIIPINYRIALPILPAALQEIKQNRLSDEWVFRNVILKEFPDVAD